MVSNVFYFHPYLGRWSNSTNIFQMGWNHQPKNYPFLFGPVVFSLVIVARFGTHLAKQLDEVGGKFFFFFSKTVFFFWKACFIVVISCYMLKMSLEDVGYIPDNFCSGSFVTVWSPIRPVVSVIFWWWLWFSPFSDVKTLVLRFKFGHVWERLFMQTLLESIR